MRNTAATLSLFLLSSATYAQFFTRVSSTEGKPWQQSVVVLQNEREEAPVNLEVTGKENLAAFRAWGATFNELGWDALNLLPGAQQETILEQLFSPDGGLRFTVGRIPMNANDYARNWYSCDEVDGDFELKYFNLNAALQAHSFNTFVGRL